MNSLNFFSFFLLKFAQNGDNALARAISYQKASAVSALLSAKASVNSLNKVSERKSSCRNCGRGNVIGVVWSCNCVRAPVHFS